ncbi:flagellar protein FliT [Lachnospiraceae bacterium]|nr:flagellar protein FliT [Lachnospiraceae bacterium]
MQDREYITVLIQSLEKKKAILDIIIDKNKEQGVLFANEDSDPDRLEENIQEKNDLINQLGKLDDGFQQIYDRIKLVLQQQKESYQEEIRMMKQLITEVTDRSATVQAQEQRNRDLALKRFSSVKGNIRQARASNQVASQYYKSMSKLNVVDSQFMDKKK